MILYNHNSFIQIKNLIELYFKLLYFIVCLALAATSAAAHTETYPCRDDGFLYITGHKPCKDVCPPTKITDVNLKFCRTNCPGTFYYVICQH